MIRKKIEDQVKKLGDGFFPPSKKLLSLNLSSLNYLLQSTLSGFEAIKLVYSPLTDDEEKLINGMIEDLKKMKSALPEIEE